MYFFEVTYLLFFSFVLANTHALRPYSSRPNTKLDCSKFKSDNDVFLSLSFRADPNPSLGKSAQSTYSLWDGDKLYYLNIANEQMVSPIIFCFKHIEELYIHKTSFPDGRIPAEIKFLAPTLVSFGVFDTPITHVAEEIGQLPHLQSLELVRTGLRTLPESIGYLPALNYMNLSWNMLTALPKTIVNALSLRQVDISHNPTLTSLDSFNDHPSLQVIIAENCSIDKLPVNLPKLTDLYMANNKLTNLVNIRTLGYQSNTKIYFYFNNNQIDFIHPQIRFVDNLYSLDLNNNRLKTLPSDIFQTPNLHFFSMEYNYFNSSQLKRIVYRFNDTNPALTLIYKRQRIPPN
ncbi:unnamed protein product [Adineta ricciae]|uniref:Uncharacterized protein n=1 Tax=Adineta ricciae TaxID=249248 RepID=A0A814NSZ6_ADIRI|nr:unnamed protein product [Adineta ricciae]CAF1228023.1 unnamed protein product [Adineta ricciae]